MTLKNNSHGSSPLSESNEAQTGGLRFCGDHYAGRDCAAGRSHNLGSVIPIDLHSNGKCRGGLRRHLVDAGQRNGAHIPHGDIARSYSNSAAVSDDIAVSDGSFAGIDEINICSVLNINSFTSLVIPFPSRLRYHLIASNIIGRSSVWT